MYIINRTILSELMHLDLEENHTFIHEYVRVLFKTTCFNSSFVSFHEYASRDYCRKRHMTEIYRTLLHTRFSSLKIPSGEHNILHFKILLMFSMFEMASTIQKPCFEI